MSWKTNVEIETPISTRLQSSLILYAERLWLRNMMDIPYGVATCKTVQRSSPTLLRFDRFEIPESNDHDSVDTNRTLLVDQYQWSCGLLTPLEHQQQQ